VFLHLSRPHLTTCRSLRSRQRGACPHTPAENAARFVQHSRDLCLCPQACLGKMIVLNPYLQLKEVPRYSSGGHTDSCENTHASLFLNIRNFPFLCPEPVLVKRSFSVYGLMAKDIVRFSHQRLDALIQRVITTGRLLACIHKQKRACSLFECVPCSMLVPSLSW
jgi:hypothetical protein